MQIRNTQARWGIVAQSLHWLVFILFVAQFVSAEVMMDMAESPEKWEFYALHKSIGVLLLFIVFLRISWRMSSTAPERPHGMPKMQAVLAGSVHALLYVAMIVMPISGYAMSMSGSHGIVFFGLFNLPDFIGPSKEISKLSHEVHEIGGIAIYVLVGVHVIGALWHHFIEKDTVLKRMLPWG